MLRMRPLVCALALMAAVVSCLPTSLLEDAKEAQMRTAANKVKRAQEVILFGNQQNRPAETTYFHNPDKRASVNQYRYYGGGDDQRGREEGLFAAPNKRSGSSSFRPMVPHALPATQQGVARLKRDLELDPEDVLALLSLWEAQHHNNYPYRAPATNWPQYNGYESPDDFDTPEDDGNTEDEEESPNGNWLEGPVYPSSATTYPGGHYSLEKRPSYYYPSYPVQKREGQWGTFPKDKRFMVSRKRQAGGVHSLAQLLNSVPRRDPGVPVYRRVVL